MAQGVIQSASLPEPWLVFPIFPIYFLGLPVCSVREIGILMQLDHRNIVRLHGVAVGKGLDSMFLVMTYCEQDLAVLIDNMRIPFTEAQVSCLG